MCVGSCARAAAGTLPACACVCVCVCAGVRVRVCVRACVTSHTRCAVVRIRPAARRRRRNRCSHGADRARLGRRACEPRGLRVVLGSPQQTTAIGCIARGTRRLKHSAHGSVGRELSDSACSCQLPESLSWGLLVLGHAQPWFLGQRRPACARGGRLCAPRTAAGWRGDISVRAPSLGLR